MLSNGRIVRKNTCYLGVADGSTARRAHSTLYPPLSSQYDCFLRSPLIFRTYLQRSVLDDIQSPRKAIHFGCGCATTGKGRRESNEIDVTNSRRVLAVDVERVRRVFPSQFASFGLCARGTLVRPA